MANTKKAILDALVDDLSDLSSIKTATRVLLTPNKARDAVPYVGLISGTEEILVEDTTHIRYGLDMDLLLVTKGDDIEEMIDDIKNYLYDTDTPTSIGVKAIQLIGQQPVTLIEQDGFSSSRIVVYVTYVSTKGAF